jgi:hypothetical protein
MELGLPENTSWDEIFAYVDERERSLLTQELGLPTYPGAREHGYSEYPSWRYILTAVLDLDHTASVEEILLRIRGNKKGDS